MVRCIVYKQLVAIDDGLLVDFSRRWLARGDPSTNAPFASSHSLVEVGKSSCRHMLSLHIIPLGYLKLLSYQRGGQNQPYFNIYLLTPAHVVLVRVCLSLDTYTYLKRRTQFTLITDQLRREATRRSYINIRKISRRRCLAGRSSTTRQIQSPHSQNAADKLLLLHNGGGQPRTLL